jgi:hypothetical protein
VPTKADLEPYLGAEKARWAALALAVSLVFHAIANVCTGNYEQAGVDLTGALGTFGIGRCWEVQIRQTKKPDISGNVYPSVPGPKGQAN